MRPALTTPSHAVQYGVAIAVLALLPILVPGRVQPSRRELYASAGLRLGPWGFITQQLFDERTPVDIAFVGSSELWCAIDTPWLQADLQRRLGRPATVRTFGWPGAGFDVAYYVTKDLLEHRKVNMVVVYDEPAADRTHKSAHRWYRYSDDPDALAGVPLDGAAALYAAATLAMPRSLLSSLRPSGTLDPAPVSRNYWEEAYRAPDPPTRLGALSARLGYPYDPNFAEFYPRPFRGNGVLYSSATATKFRFKGAHPPAYQWAFLQRLARLVHERGAKLVFLDMPAMPDHRGRRITERVCWPCELSPRVRLAGIPPAELYAGLSSDDVRRLYFNVTHLNLNGQRHFTRAVASTLEKMLDE